MSTSPEDIANECIAFGVRRVARLVNNHYDRYLSPTGLRHTQFTLLNALEVLGPVQVNELAEQMATDRTTLTRNLDVLVKEGLVQRTTGADRRSRELRLTEHGKQIAAEARAAWAEAQQVLVEQVGRANYRQLMAELDYLEEAFAEL